MKKILLIIILMFVAIHGNADSHFSAVGAPFGLNWGDTKAQLENQGIMLDDCRQNGLFLSCSTTKTPKPVSFGSVYLLAFVMDEQNSGLQKLGVFGKDIKNDITGRSGKELYQKVKTSLIKKYGEPSNAYEYVGKKLYDGYDEFYQCLGYNGCGNWVSYWFSANGGSISLELHGKFRGEGNLRLSYESEKFSHFIGLQEKQKNLEDEDAL